jgi:hypothetical protein
MRVAPAACACGSASDTVRAMGMRKLLVVLAGATALLLVAMMILSFTTGVTQEAYEWYLAPAEYARGIAEHPETVRLVFAIDVGFLVLYTAFFTTLSRYLGRLGRPYVRLALAFMLGTAVLDIVEDHHIATILDMVLRGRLPSDLQLAAQQVMSGTKFTLSYISLVLFGLAIPRDRKLGIALCVFLTVGTVASAILNNATGEALRAQNATGRWFGFLLGFALIVAWLRDAPDVDEATAAGGPPARSAA